MRLLIIPLRVFHVRNQYQQVFLAPLLGRKTVYLDNLGLAVPCIILLSFSFISPFSFILPFYYPYR